MYPLDNRIQEYAWGSKTVIADLLGRSSPSETPQAELWMGAHPQAPSRAEREGAWHSLYDLIQRDPERELGARVASRFNGALPFLFKVLAAEAPLSLQAHPSLEQAREGFEADERAHIPLGAPHRNYRDRNHKPELLCALGPFEALSGFRRAADTLQLLAALHIEPLAPGLVLLARNPDHVGQKALFSWLMGSSRTLQSELVSATLEACRRYRETEGAFAAECAWALELGRLYRDDIGVVVALLLNLVRLEAGQAIYLPAGNLHAYLKGAGLEIMANSDNVLRGGLTPKHVNVPELLRILDFSDGPVTVLTPHGDSVEQSYETPTTEFALSRISLHPGNTFSAVRREGPEILLCLEGSAHVSTERSGIGEDRTLTRGRTLFVPGSSGGYTLRGEATVYRAHVGPAIA